MPNSVQDTVNLAMQGIIVAGVAVMVMKAIGEEHHSIPWEAKKPLIEKYGLWAVNIAESVCPHNDVACVEREAERLYETRISRR